MPKEAAEFAQWLNTDPKPLLELTNPDKAGLFPVTQATLVEQGLVGCRLRLTGAGRRFTR